MRTVGYFFYRKLAQEDAGDRREPRFGHPCCVYYSFKRCLIKGEKRFVCQWRLFTTFNTSRIFIIVSGYHRDHGLARRDVIKYGGQGQTFTRNYLPTTSHKSWCRVTYRSENLKPNILLLCAYLTFAPNDEFPPNSVWTSCHCRPTKTAYGIELRPLNCSDRGFESCWGHRCLSPVFAACCVGRGLCEGPTTHPEESYRVRACVSPSHWMWSTPATTLYTYNGIRRKGSIKTVS